MKELGLSHLHCGVGTAPGIWGTVSWHSARRGLPGPRQLENIFGELRVNREQSLASAGAVSLIPLVNQGSTRALAGAHWWSLLSSPQTPVWTSVCLSLALHRALVPARDLGRNLEFCPPWGLHQGSHALPPCAEPQYFRFEGVWLTETGMAVLRNLTMSPLHKRRQRRGRLGLPGEAGLEGSEPSDALGPDDKKDGDLDTDELLKGEGQAEGSQGVPE